MKKAVVLGHFAFGMNKSNGQTVKTQNIANELRRHIGEENVGLEDTVGGLRFLLKLPFVLFKLLWNYSNIIILPAYKGVLTIIPALTFLNIFFHRRIHYVVIGGWLPTYMKKHPLLRFSCKHIYMIYVETLYMKTALNAMGFQNVKVMPNFKQIDILREDELTTAIPATLKVCTFSRVMKEKGIEDAVKAVVECNKRLGEKKYVLDIYGMIEAGQEQWFKDLMQCQQPEEINYKGVANPSESSTILKAYFAMLFPTLFPTEGFPGTVIDAFSAGLPTIASDCTSIKELLIEGETGFIYPMHSVPALTDILFRIANHPETTISMRKKCLQAASRYKPENVIPLLTSELD